MGELLLATKHRRGAYVCSSAQLPPIADAPVATIVQGWHHAGFEAQKSWARRGAAAAAQDSKGFGAL